MFDTFMLLEEGADSGDMAPTATGTNGSQGGLPGYGSRWRGSNQGSPGIAERLLAEGEWMRPEIPDG